MRPLAALLPDGKRLHLQHGPIDLIVEAEGNAPEARRDAYRAAADRFETILPVLVEELPRLRTPCPADGLGLEGPVARRMEAAVRPHASRFVTPMAAVAGAVADTVLAAMVDAAPLTRAYVNNGGDIALHLAAGCQFSLMIAGLDGGDAGRIAIDAASPVRGIATSGRGGRSLSLGIADSVTVLARNAAMADAAATLIANAVDLPGNPAIERAPACSVDPDSDLGDRLVTTGSGPLTLDEIAQALQAGLGVAEAMQADGLIEAAALILQGDSRTTHPMPSSPDFLRGSLWGGTRTPTDARVKPGHDGLRTGPRVKRGDDDPVDAPTTNKKAIAHA